MVRFVRHADFATLLFALTLLALPAVPAGAQFVEIQRNSGQAVGLYDPIYPKSLLQSNGPGMGYRATPAQEKSDRGVDLFAREGASFDVDRGITANIQVVKINVGEPEGKHVPFYLFLSPAEGTGNDDAPEGDVAAAQLLNPVGGTINLSTAQTWSLLKKDYEYTSLRLGWHTAAKYSASGDLTTPGEVASTVVGYGDAGLHFQTGAWRADGEGKMGVFWLAARVGASVGSRDYFSRVFGNDLGGCVGHWSIFGGLEIDQLINVRTGVSRAFSSRGVVALDEPVIRLVFDVTPKRAEAVREAAATAAAAAKAGSSH